MTSAIGARDCLIVAGDSNARVGSKDRATSKVLGNLGLGQRSTDCFQYSFPA